MSNEKTPMTQPNVPRKLPTRVRAVRTGLSMLGTLSPGLAGKIATDLFLKTRPGKRPNDGTPLGAKRLSLATGSVIDHAYVWPKKGPTVLLVHGWGTDSSSMYSIARALGTAGYRVVTYDAPAHGASPGNRATMTEFVRALSELIDELGDVQALVSHSLGSIATIAALARHKGTMPKQIILISPPCTMNEILRGFADYLQLSPRVVERVRGELLRRNGVPVDHWDIGTLGENLHIPTMVIHDREDPLVPLAEGEKVSGFLPDARLEVTAGLGHQRILLDNATHTLVTEFLGAGQPLSA
jgi:omega-6 fatty acid desaturase (delta-12 desaturase)